MKPWEKYGQAGEPAAAPAPAGPWAKYATAAAPVSADQPAMSAPSAPEYTSADALRRGVKGLEVVGQLIGSGYGQLADVFLPEADLGGFTRDMLGQSIEELNQLPSDPNLQQAAQNFEQAPFEGKSFAGALWDAAGDVGAEGFGRLLVEQVPSLVLGGGVGGVAGRKLALGGAEAVAPVVGARAAAGAAAPSVVRGGAAEAAAQQYAGAAAREAAERAFTQGASRAGIGAGMTAGQVIGSATGPNIAQEVEAGQDIDSAVRRGLASSLTEAAVNAPAGALAPFSLAASPMRNIALQTGLQSAAGAGGAAAGSAVVGGQADAVELMLEAMFGGVTAPIDIAVVKAPEVRAALRDALKRRVKAESGQDISDADADLMIEERIQAAEEASQAQALAPENVAPVIDQATGVNTPAPLGAGMPRAEARQARRQVEQELGSLFENETDVLRREDVDVTDEGLQLREGARPAQDPAGRQAQPSTLATYRQAADVLAEAGVEVTPENLDIAVSYLDAGQSPVAAANAFRRAARQGDMREGPTAREQVSDQRRREVAEQAFRLAEARRERAKQDTARVGFGRQGAPTGDYRAGAARGVGDELSPRMAQERAAAGAQPPAGVGEGMQAPRRAVDRVAETLPGGLAGEFAPGNQPSPAPDAGPSPRTGRIFEQWEQIEGEIRQSQDGERALADQLRLAQQSNPEAVPGLRKQLSDQREQTQRLTQEQAALPAPDQTTAPDAGVDPAQQAEAEARTLANQLREAEARAAKAEADLAARQQADADRSDSPLTGSNHAADVAAARGQQDSLSQPTAEPTAETRAGDDRRTEQAPVAEERRETAGRREGESVSEVLQAYMNGEELTLDQWRLLATHSEVTPLRNKREFTRAWVEHQRRKAADPSYKMPKVVFIDADSLKWYNDNVSHEAGDALLVAVGEELVDAGADAFHVSGDEFLVIVADDASGAQMMDSVQERLAQRRDQFTSKDGQEIEINGYYFTYGVGDNVVAADKKMQATKEAKEKAGERAARGEQPASVRYIGDDAGATNRSGQAGDPAGEPVSGPAEGSGMAAEAGDRTGGAEGSRGADGDESGTVTADGDAYFEDRALERARNPGEASRERLVYMSPDDFLAMAENLSDGPVASKMNPVRRLVETGTKFDEVPFLKFTHDGKGKATVDGHEGRHRAYMLREMGVQQMPIVLKSAEYGAGQGIRWGRQGRAPGSFDVIDGPWPETLAGQSSGSIPFPVPDLRRATASGPEADVVGDIPADSAPETAADTDTPKKGPSVQFYSGIPLDAIAAKLKELFGGEVKLWANQLARNSQIMNTIKTAMAGRRPGVNPVAQAIRMYWLDSDQRLRSIAERANMPGVKRIADAFFLRAGDAAATGRETFHGRLNKRLNSQIDKVEGIRQAFEDAGLNMDDATMLRVRRMLENPNTPRLGKLGEVVRKMETFFKDELAYQRDAGLETGEVKGYLPRVIDKGRIGANAKNKAAFVAAAAKAYQIDSPGMSNAQAHEMGEMRWQREMFGDARGTPGLTLNAGSPGAADFMKGRTLSQKAVEQSGLQDFMVNNPFNLMLSYLQSSAMRAELAKTEVELSDGSTVRLGPNWANWAQIKQDLVKEGGDTAYEFMNEIEQMVAVVSGIEARKHYGRVARVSSWARTISTMGLLELATLTSLPEPLVAGMRMMKGGSAAGVATDLANALQSTVRYGGDAARLLLRLPKRERLQATYDLLHSLGEINANNANAMSVDRFAGGEPASLLQSELLASYFRGVRLEQFTNYSVTFAAENSMTFMRQLAKDLAAGGKRADNARIHFRDLNIPAAQIDSFAAYVNSLNGANPTAVELADAGRNGALYAGAISKFINESVMRPSSATKPGYAAHPVGAAIFQLQSFPFMYTKQVLSRPFRVAKAQASEIGTLEAGLVALPFLISMASIVGLQSLLGGLRDEFAELTSGKETPEQSGLFELERALSWAGAFGKADPILQMISGSRYQKSVAESAAGPTAGRIINAADTLLAFGANNSPGTNTAERKLWTTTMDLVIEPFLQATAGLLPDKGLTGTVMLAARAAGPRTVREQVGEAIEPKEAKPRFSLAERLVGADKAPKRDSGRERGRERGREGGRENGRW